MPIKAPPDQPVKVIKAMQLFQTLNDPSPRTVVGLSNVSNGAKERSLLNRTFLGMLMGVGLSAAIVDVQDADLMNVIKAGELLKAEKLYCDDFLRA